ncbi:Oidioi.mRNA.OKI2018_I69.chr2.g7995.t1.cds [Oikopleura dioica]|uniref:Oidioi.mRNA.OKI2018_I69.chr2.g7995.t1.cds n=1 Tax=Oikopleura dioica TaxID=34765 RepID=A0ABN7TCL2_OIKDI|nr:Oidioi.mRNA.OKI2018_I69.chr2.g7995.t1.cds [Oikopleura dioica]
MKAIYFVAFFDLFAVSLIVPSLSGHFLENNVVWVGSIYGIAQLFSQPFFGRLADSYGTRNVTICSLLISSFSYYLLSQGTGLAILILARIIAGGSKQTQELSRLVIVNEETEENRARVVGLFNSIGSAGFILGPMISGFIRESFPTDGFYICAKLTSLIFVMNAALVFFFVEQNNSISQKKEKSKKEQPGIKSTVSQLLKMWDLCLLRLMLTMAILMARFVMPILSERAFGPVRAGMLTSYTSLAGTVSAALASNIIPNLSKTYDLKQLELFTCAGLAASVLALALLWGNSFWLLFLAVLFINCFFTQCSRILLTQLTVARAPVENRGTIMGSVTSLTAVSRSLCDFANAFLLSFGDLGPLLASALLCSFSSLLVAKAIPKTKLKAS